MNPYDLEHIVDCDNEKRPKVSRWTYREKWCTCHVKISHEGRHSFCKDCGRCSLCGSWMAKKSTSKKGYIGVICDIVNNVEVLDLDVIKDKDKDKGLKDGVKWFEENIGPVEDQNTFIVRTPSGGYHLYYEYGTPFENASRILPGVKVDFRGKGVGYACFGPGYKIVVNKAPSKIPDKLLKALDNEKDDDIDDNIQKVVDEFEGSPEEIVSVTEAEIREMLDKVLEEHIDNYDSWIRILFVCKNLAKGKDTYKEDFRRMSMKNSKYDLKSFEYHWNKVGYHKHGLGYGTLVQYAKEKRLLDSSSCVSSINQTNVAIDILKTCRNQLRLCNKVLWGREYTNRWTCVPKEVYDIMCLVMCKRNIQPTQYKYVAEQIRLLAHEYVLDNEFENSFENIDKICFKNGVYDFNDKSFTLWKNSSTVTDKILPYDYGQVNMEVVGEIYRRILNPTFDDDHELLQEYLRVCSRSLAGNYTDKYWGACRGERDSGKGVLTSLFMRTFGEYFGTFNPSNLLNEHQHGDQEKNNRWMIDFSKKRLIFGNEIVFTEGSYINGTTIKQIASGGDVFKARLLYNEPFDIKMRAFLLLCFNDMPEVRPSDALSNLLYFNFPTKFGDRSDFATTRKSDPSIKLWASTFPDIPLAFFHIIAENYGPCSYDILRKYAKELIINSEGNEDKKIKNMFIFTKSDNDGMFLKDIDVILKRENIIISPGKLKQRLERWGAIHYTTCGKTKYKRIKINQE
jgi:hypothetical protein